jgi:hypothetical protein
LTPKERFGQFIAEACNAPKALILPFCHKLPLTGAKVVEGFLSRGLWRPLSNAESKNMACASPFAPRHLDRGSPGIVRPPAMNVENESPSVMVEIRQQFVAHTSGSVVVLS